MSTPDDDELDESLRAELRALAPPDPDHGAGSADLRRAVRLGVDALARRREARRARWRFLTPLFGTGVAAAAALTLYLKADQAGVPPIATPTPAAADASALAIVETPSTLTPEPLDDEGDDLLEPLELTPASDDLDDTFAVIPAVDDDDDDLLDDADLSELDDLDPASLARVADALKGT